MTKRERALFSSLSSPAKIQAFLDRLPCSAEETYRSPLSVLRDRKAHCFDGALFGAAALRRLGHPPLVIDMFAARDDDHLLAIYKRDGFYGAVAKSNFVGLRFREPVYHSLRELVLSYFEQYYNVDREKTLRSYTAPLDLKPFDRVNWMWSDDGLDVIARRLDEIPRVPLLTARMIRNLAPVDMRSHKAGLLGVNAAGLYRPKKKGS